ncbi:diguanylate cyclase (GGDEF)-like protein [Halopolyspora algeriensis]|uniref:Diguanylate cyclase (GGDEF)-like protein n=1 Tax=Halopolyspora algeriensis TaxID=1500506 RepID=A0A368VYG2_9ACTN|nr:GGDEF domain-containing protein [Halopolyspora algeriensis]RCW47027.1 diguanylate cyclase (GGDEF)-like protein [Halopolyspora algeriensis]TQM48114.1 diguanylate cyclase (GGDEF)-like protein [Halopolyspora algeriensis]
MNGLRNEATDPEPRRADAAGARCTALAPPSGSATAPMPRAANPAEHSSSDPPPSTGTDEPDPDPREDGEPGDDTSGEAGLIELHETTAELLASRGQWQQAYRHLRSALDIRSTHERPQIPEQLRHEVDRLRREHAHAREQSLRDSLTASYNRRYLDERLTELLAHSTGGGLGVALVDLDWFKSVNDTHGHVLGDRVLQRVVELLQEALPSDGFCARYGGEEFTLVLPDIDTANAVAICESARARIERFPWSRMAPGLRVTVSIGLSHEGRPHAPGATAEQQILNADVLLYTAKQSGRNTVVYRSAGESRSAGYATGSETLGAARGW